MDLLYAYQEWPYAEAFRISRSTSVNSELFIVYIRDGEWVGRGECGLLPQYGQTRTDVELAFEAARRLFVQGATPRQVVLQIENSSARNAIDSASWDLECKRAGADIWQETGIAKRDSIEVDLTIGINSTPKMCADAAAAAKQGYRILKLKADKDDVLERVSAIARACPDVRLIIDANEAWDIETLNALSAPLEGLGVALIEQPLHHKADDALRAYTGAIPLCADESCSSIDDLPRLSALYQAVNIKLDKVGGLTAGIELNRAAKARNLAVMLGCSVPTSLGAAPAYVLGTLCDFVDLDGPALLLDDREHAMRYRDGRLLCFEPSLWGGRADQGR
jgi:L-alanine-DL-glutamate epimerase-like enolase superfamily enzyme